LAADKVPDSIPRTPFWALVSLFSPDSHLVSDRWTGLTVAIPVAVYGDHTWEVYSSCGLTYVMNVMPGVHMYSPVHCSSVNLCYAASSDWHSLCWCIYADYK